MDEERDNTMILAASEDSSVKTLGNLDQETIELLVEDKIDTGG